jgi:hypothetical protein
VSASARPAELLARALGEPAHHEVVGVLDEIADELVGHGAVQREGVPVPLVQVVAGPDRRVGAAELDGRVGFAFHAHLERAAVQRAQPNIVPPTFKTEVRGPNGNSSTAPV